MILIGFAFKKAAYGFHLEVTVLSYFTIQTEKYLFGVRVNLQILTEGTGRKII